MRHLIFLFLDKKTRYSIILHQRKQEREREGEREKERSREREREGEKAGGDQVSPEGQSRR